MGKSEDTEKLISMRTIAIELRDEQRSKDKVYEELNHEGRERTEEEEEQLSKLEEKYDEFNYYRRILRYAQNIFQLSDEFYKDKNNEYLIAENEKWLVKAMLEEFMSPFLKTIRSKTLSQIKFDQFDLFISHIEEAIKSEYKDELDRQVELQLLNFYTGYERRRHLYSVKERVESTISEDWNMLNELMNPGLKIQLLQGYRNAIEDFSKKWREEISIHVDSEDAVINEMVEEDTIRMSLYDEDEQKQINESIATDFKDMHISYNEEIGPALVRHLSKDEQEKIETKLHKWEEIIRAERE